MIEFLVCSGHKLLLLISRHFMNVSLNSTVDMNSFDTNPDFTILRN